MKQMLQMPYFRGNALSSEFRSVTFHGYLIGKALLGLALIVFLAYAPVLSFDGTTVEETRAYLKEMTRPLMSFGEPAKNQNLTDQIEIVCGTDLDDDLKQLIDNDFSTGLNVSSLSEKLLELRYRGRPPWANMISVIHYGRLELDLSVKDIYKQHREIESAPVVFDLGDGLFETRIVTDDMWITSLLLDFSANSDISARIVEMETYFFGFDIGGRGDDFFKESAVEAVAEYEAGYCGNEDIWLADVSGQNFADALENFAEYNPVVSKFNSNARAMHFVYNFHRNSVDKADITFFQGHGRPRRIFFSYPLFDCYASCGDCRLRWGDDDMEWIALYSSRTFYGFFSRFCYRRCFDGLHIACGLSRNTRHYSGVGPYFARELDTPGRTIIQAWQRTYSFFNDCDAAGRAYILGHSFYFRERLPGTGKSYPDIDQGSYMFELVEVPEETALPKSRYDNMTMTTITGKRLQIPPIKMSQELLDRALAEPVPELNVIPRIVDEYFVGNLADSYCSNYGFLCPGNDTLYDTAFGIYSYYDGPHELTVDEHSGSWYYMEGVKYLDYIYPPPVLPSESDAADSADQFLQNIGWLPSDAYQVEPRHMRVFGIDTTTEIPDPDSTFDLNVIISYQRERSGYRIAGPGASMGIDLGEGGEILSAFCGGWRDVAEGDMITPISLSEALEDLVNCQSNFAVGGMPACDTFLIDTAELGYYEPPGSHEVEQLEISWLIDGFCISYLEDTEEVDTSYYLLILPARYRHPYCQIDLPTVDTVIVQGNSVGFAGSAAAGTPPYTFNWYSDIDGYLGSGDAIEVPALSWSPDEVLIHSITLEVTDANDMKDYAGVSVSVIPIRPVSTIVPDPMYAIYAYCIEPIPATAYLNAQHIDGSYLLEEINTSTLAINDIIPGGTDIIDDNLEVYFDARDFVAGYGILWDTTYQLYALTGEFNDGTPFTQYYTATFIGHWVGDINLDGFINILDVTFLIRYIYYDGAPPIVPETADLNSDGTIDLRDIVSLIRLIF